MPMTMLGMLNELDALSLLQRNAIRQTPCLLYTSGRSNTLAAALPTWRVFIHILSTTAFDIIGPEKYCHLGVSSALWIGIFRFLKN